MGEGWRLGGIGGKAWCESHKAGCGGTSSRMGENSLNLHILYDFNNLPITLA